MGWVGGEGGACVYISFTWPSFFLIPCRLQTEEIERRREWVVGWGEVVGNGDVMTTFIALIISLLAARFSRRVAALPRRTCR